MSATERWRHHGRWLGRWALLAALYTAAAVLFTWPLAQQIQTHIWGDRFDAWTTIWLIWHLSSAEWTAHTSAILYPLGYDLWSFGHLGLQVIGAALVKAGLPLITAYNALAIGALASSALGAHALGEKIAAGLSARARLGAGLFAAAIFAFNPYLYGELRAGCLELVAAGLLPLFALSLLRLVERPGWRGVLLAGVILAITGPFNWYYAVFGGMFGVAFAVWQVLGRRWRAAGAVLCSLALGLALVAPLLPRVAAETPSRSPIAAEQFSPARWAASRAVADGEADLALVDDQMLLDLDAQQVVLNATPISNLLDMGFPSNPLESTPGPLAWVLGLAGLAAAGRRAWGWAALALGFSVLTLGPYALLDRSPPLPEWSLQHPLPYLYLYNDLPLFSKAYRPYRLAVLVLICLSALAATGVARLAASGRHAERADRWIPAAALAALILAAASPRLRANADDNLRDGRSPAGYLAVAGRSGALIELPLASQPLSIQSARAQYEQVVHGRSLLNCNQLIRRTELAAFRDLVGGNAFLGAMVDLARRPGPWSFSSEDAAALKDQGFSDLVLHSRVEAEADPLAGYQGAADRLGLAALRMLEESLGPPWLDSGGLVVFSLRDGARGGTWESSKVSPLVIPQVEAGLSVQLKDGQRLRLASGEGGARRVGLWLQTGHGRFALQLQRGDQVTDLPIDPEGLPDGPAWVWARLDLGAADDPSPWTLDLIGAGEGWLARPELESW